MPNIETSPGVTIHCEIDDYTDPWVESDCVLMLHGIAETGNAWKSWAPAFARRFRVIRPDLRGFGQSTRLDGLQPKDMGPWADDLDALMRKLGCKRVHVIGAKLGALAGMELARRRVPWIKTMTIAGLLISPKKAIGPWVPDWLKHIDEKGMESWARLTMPGRMGDAIGAEATEWWVREMAEAPPESVKACLTMVKELGEAEGLEQFQVPTLVLVSSGKKSEGGDFEQRQSVDAVDRFRSRIPDSELATIEATSYHVAATHPDACAERVLQFIDAHGG
jgi:3-oxoadipate enol-lactonase